MKQNISVEGLHSSLLHVRSSPAFLMVSQKLLTPAVNSTVSIPRYGCPHPFSYINPCVNGVSLPLLIGLVLSTTLCTSFLQ